MNKGIELFIHFWEDNTICNFENNEGECYLCDCSEVCKSVKDYLEKKEIIINDSDECKVLNTDNKLVDEYLYEYDE